VERGRGTGEVDDGGGPETPLPSVSGMNRREKMSKTRIAARERKRESRTNPSNFSERGNDSSFPQEEGGATPILFHLWGERERKNLTLAGLRGKRGGVQLPLAEGEQQLIRGKDRKEMVQKGASGGKH